MKNFIFFFSFLFCFCCFCDSATVTVYVYGNQSPDTGSAISTSSVTVDSVSPSQTFSVSIPSLPCWVSLTLTGNATVKVDGHQYSGQYFRFEQGSSFTVEITLNSSSVDPENPVDPDPDNPDNPDGPWALESTLQNTNSMLQALGSGLRDWSSAQMPLLRQLADDSSNIRDEVSEGFRDSILKFDDIKGALDNSNSKLDNIKGTLDNSNSKLDNIKGTLDTTNSGINNVKNTLDRTNSGITNVKNTLDTTNSRIQNVKNTLDTTNSHLNNVRSNTSETVGKLRDLNDLLNPSNSQVAPSVSSPSSSLPSQTGFISGIKNKILPGFSFFNPSGDEWLSFHFTVPLSHFGMEDFTFVLGGSDWQTAAGGSLLTLMSITRSLSKFAFYLMFLMAVIKSLRQW